MKKIAVRLIVGLIPSIMLVLTPYSSKQDVHLIANLSYPKNPPLLFIKEFTALVNDFEKYLD